MILLLALFLAHCAAQHSFFKRRGGWPLELVAPSGLTRGSLSSEIDQLSSAIAAQAVSGKTTVGAGGVCLTDFATSTLKELRAH